ncbi:MAG: cytochrome c [Planctomycetes bacterium]|nr:cytochrome c [Planctomycetota bacterium]MCC7169832.1 cytochrome c [Planctomycetota bacterium]
MARTELLLAGAIALAACASTPPPPPLPFDVRPTMTGLRVDTLAIARGLEAANQDGVVSNARRLESIVIVPPGADAGAEFDSLAAGFTSAARLLRGSLESDDLPRARIAFSQLLQRCDACHARFRAPAR